jgi:hypothetical protein
MSSNAAYRELSQLSKPSRLILSLFSASPLELFQVCLQRRLRFPQPHAVLCAIRQESRQGRCDLGVPLPCQKRFRQKKSRQFPGLRQPMLRSVGLPPSNSRSFLPAQLSSLRSCFFVPFPSLLPSFAVWRESPAEFVERKGKLVQTVPCAIKIAILRLSLRDLVHVSALIGEVPSRIRLRN